jgi:hypothetical protein
MAKPQMLRWVLLLALVSTARGEDTIALYYKQPLRQPLIYRTRVDEQVVAGSRTTVRKEQIIENSYQLVAPERLRVTALFRTPTTILNGKEVRVRSADRTTVREMDVKGYRRKVNKQASDFDKLEVILPNYRVKVGESWEYTAPATSDLPVYLTTRYTLTSLERDGARELAIIDCKALADVAEPTRRLNIRVRATGHILFAYREGILVSSEFNYQLVTDPLAGGGRGHVEKTVRTVMKLAGQGHK